MRYEDTKRADAEKARCGESKYAFSEINDLEKSISLLTDKVQRLGLATAQIVVPPDNTKQVESDASCEPSLPKSTVGAHLYGLAKDITAQANRLSEITDGILANQ